MSPLKIGILLHYSYAAEDYRGGDFSAPAVREAIDWFVSEKALRKLGWAETFGGAIKYGLTDRGRAFISHICDLPLPVCKWEMPA